MKHLFFVNSLWYAVNATCDTASKKSCQDAKLKCETRVLSNKACYKHKDARCIEVEKGSTCKEFDVFDNEVNITLKCGVSACRHNDDGSVCLHESEQSCICRYGKKNEFCNDDDGYTCDDELWCSSNECKLLGNIDDTCSKNSECKSDLLCVNPSTGYTGAGTCQPKISNTGTCAKDVNGQTQLNYNCESTDFKCIAEHDSLENTFIPCSEKTDKTKCTCNQVSRTHKCNADLPCKSNLICTDSNGIKTEDGEGKCLPQVLNGASCVTDDLNNANCKNEGDICMKRTDAKGFADSGVGDGFKCNTVNLYKFCNNDNQCGNDAYCLNTFNTGAANSENCGSELVENDKALNEQKCHCEPYGNEAATCLVSLTDSAHQGKRREKKCAEGLFCLSDEMLKCNDATPQDSVSKFAECKCRRGIKSGAKCEHVKNANNNIPCANSDEACMRYDAKIYNRIYPTWEQCNNDNDCICRKVMPGDKCETYLVTKTDNVWDRPAWGESCQCVLSCDLQTSCDSIASYAGTTPNHACICKPSDSDNASTSSATPLADDTDNDETKNTTASTDNAWQVNRWWPSFTLLLLIINA